jgi:thymidylate synthase (FAD)
MDAHAQKEIRLYADVLFDMAKKVAPLCCASFERHVLEGVSFSGEEFAELKLRLGTTGAEGEQAEGTTLTGKALERFEEKMRAGRQK